MGAIALVFAPLIAAAGAGLAPCCGADRGARHVDRGAASATAIQLWFRTQAKRSHFRRRQTSSRLATFAEAFSSITWAATAALAAAGTWLALFPAVTALGILLGVRLIRPAQS